MRYKNTVTWILLVIVLSSLVSCASVPKQAFDKKDAAPVKRIALLQVAEPNDYLVQNMGGAAMAFGLIGGLIAAADASSKSDLFTQKMKEQKLTLRGQMAQAIAERLNAQGYEVVYLSDQRPRVKEDKNADYSQIKTDADAILDVWFTVVGYLSPQGSPDYQPWIGTVARLVAANDGSQLYFQSFNYGAKLGYSRDTIEYLPAESKYAYRSFDALMTNSDEAIQGLRQGIPPITTRIIEQLR
jgi:hypothetical protein